MAIGELRLSEMLETVEEFGAASVELAAWEFGIAPLVLVPLWRHAIAEGLIEPDGHNEDGEEEFACTEVARRWLSVASEPTRRRVAVCLKCATLRVTRQSVCPGCVASTPVAMARRLAVGAAQAHAQDPQGEDRAEQPQARAWQPFVAGEPVATGGYLLMR